MTITIAAAIKDTNETIPVPIMIVCMLINYKKIVTTKILGSAAATQRNIRITDVVDQAAPQVMKAKAVAQMVAQETDVHPADLMEMTVHLTRNVAQEPAHQEVENASTPIAVAQMNVQVLIGAPATIKAPPAVMETQ